MLLAGKNALVTGSSRGIGLGVGTAFLRHGAQVVFNAERHAGDFPELQAVLQSPAAKFIPADLIQPGEPERLVRQAWETLGGLDVLVNNAGTFREPAFLELTRREFDSIFGLNVWAG